LTGGCQKKRGGKPTMIGKIELILGGLLITVLLAIVGYVIGYFKTKSELTNMVDHRVKEECDDCSLKVSIKNLIQSIDRMNLIIDNHRTKFEELTLEIAKHSIEQRKLIEDQKKLCESHSLLIKEFQAIKV
jgi:hypothetical protein